MFLLAGALCLALAELTSDRLVPYPANRHGTKHPSEGTSEMPGSRIPGRNGRFSPPACLPAAPPRGRSTTRATSHTLTGTMPGCSCAPIGRRRTAPPSPVCLITTPPTRSTGQGSTMKRYKATTRRLDKPKEELRSRGFFNRGNTAFQQQDYTECRGGVQGGAAQEPGPRETPSTTWNLALLRTPPQDQDEEEEQQDEEQDEQQEKDQQDRRNGRSGGG